MQLNASHRIGVHRPRSSCMLACNSVDGRSKGQRPATASLPSHPGAATARPMQPSRFMPDNGPEVRVSGMTADNMHTWTSHWLPLSPIDLLDNKRTTAHKLLGEDLVVWWSEPEQKWSAFKDMCPHRLAPLSEGRIINGSLVCSYHGWSFGVDGACNSIPQMTPVGQAGACASKRSCATSYPTLVNDGLLYVWLDNSPAGLAESRTRAVPHAPGDESVAWNMNVFPADYQTLMESTMDPTHANHLHHGVGFNSANTIPFECDSHVPLIDRDTGFTMHHGGYEVKNKGMKATRQFIPPYQIITTYREPKVTTVLHVMTVPMQPGRARVFGRMSFLPPDHGSTTGQSVVHDPEAAAAGSSTALPAAPKLPLLYTVFTALSKWLPHWMLQPWALNDQDVVIMAGQERVRQVQSNKCYMPASADTGIIAFDKWLATAAYPAAVFGQHAEAVSETPTLEALLDRNRMHIDHCIICQQGLQLMTKVCTAITVAAGLAAALVVALSAGAILQPGSWQAACKPLLASVLLAVTLAALSRQLWEMREYKFVSGVKEWKRKGGLSLVKMA